MMNFTDLSTAMRPSLLLPMLLGVLLCLAPPAHAQEKDSRMEQILNPNPNRRFDLVYDKKAGGTKNFYSPNGRVIETKNLSGSKKFETRSAIVNAYRAEKSYSQAGGYNLSETKKKSWGFLSWFQGKSYGTKSASGAKGFSGNRAYNDAAVTASTRDYRGRETEKFKQHLTQEQAANNGYKGDLKELKSIDDVRTLLNKN